MINLGKLKEIKDLRKVWPHEALDFTPWLAEEDNLALLADAEHSRCRLYHRCRFVHRVVNLLDNPVHGRQVAGEEFQRHRIDAGIPGSIHSTGISQDIHAGRQLRHDSLHAERTPSTGTDNIHRRQLRTFFSHSLVRLGAGICHRLQVPVGVCKARSLRLSGVFNNCFGIWQHQAHSSTGRLFRDSESGEHNMPIL